LVFRAFGVVISPSSIPRKMMMMMMMMMMVAVFSVVVFALLKHVKDDDIQTHESPTL